MRKTFKKKSALITGAGSGIGQQLAIQLTKKGAYCYLVDVNKEGLEETLNIIDNKCAHNAAEIHVVDVADYQAMTRLSKKIHKEILALDYLFNNAGIGIGGPFTETSIDQWRRIVDINLMGVVHGCQLFLPKMIDHKQGHIINTASLAGLLAPEDMSAYAATKFAVVGLSESLQKEVRKHGIDVTTVCPGIINTNITRNTELNGKLAARRKDIIQLYEKRNYSAEKTANAILSGVSRRIQLLPITPESWLMYYMKRVSPPVVKTVERLINRVNK